MLCKTRADALGGLSRSAEVRRIRPKRPVRRSSINSVGEGYLQVCYVDCHSGDFRRTASITQHADVEQVPA